MTLEEKLHKELDWLEIKHIDADGIIRNILSIIQQEIADAKPKWISVKDRLPELGVNVLCYSVAKDIDDGDNDNIITMGKRFINYTQQPVFVADAGMFYEIEKILFWMPLPESPKESE